MCKGDLFPPNTKIFLSDEDLLNYQQGDDQKKLEILSKKEKFMFLKLFKSLWKGHRNAYIFLNIFKGLIFVQWQCNLYSIQYFDFGGFMIAGLVFSAVDSFGIWCGGEFGYKWGGIYSQSRGAVIVTILLIIKLVFLDIRALRLILSYLICFGTSAGAALYFVVHNELIPPNYAFITMETNMSFAGLVMTSTTYITSQEEPLPDLIHLAIIITTLFIYAYLNFLYKKKCKEEKRIKDLLDLEIQKMMRKRI